MALDRAALDAARRRTVERLLAIRDGEGTWTGELSVVGGGAAVGALTLLDAGGHAEAIYPLAFASAGLGRAVALADGRDYNRA
jgi:hypothetical protein